MSVSRADGYCAALAKTAGREFTLSGQPILTAGEEALIRGLELEDFAEAFQRAIAVKQAMMRLDWIVRGAGRP